MAIQFHMPFTNSGAAVADLVSLNPNPLTVGGTTTWSNFPDDQSNDRHVAAHGTDNSPAAGGTSFNRAIDGQKMGFCSFQIPFNGTNAAQRTEIRWTTNHTQGTDNNHQVGVFPGCDSSASFVGGSPTNMGMRVVHRYRGGSPSGTDEIIRWIDG